MQEFSIITLAVRVLTAGVIGAVSYLFICAALRPSISSLSGPIDYYENLFAAAGSTIVFALVLWRLFRGSWSREQVSKILDLDSDGY
jgi:hypothetical protein